MAAADDFETYPSNVFSADDDGGPLRVDHIYKHLTVGGHVSGILLTVSGPADRISVVEPLGGCGNGTTRVTDASREAGCVAAVNGGFFDTDTLRCLGNVVSRGRLVQNSSARNANFGIRNGKIVTGYLSTNEATGDTVRGPFSELLAGVVWLVRNGKPYIHESLYREDMSTQETGSQFSRVKSARTAIGHDAQGRVLVLHVGGKTWSGEGIDLYSLADLLVSFGAINAVNLDGGGSATMVLNDTLVSDPSDFCPASTKFRCAREVTTSVCIREQVCRAGSYRPVRGGQRCETCAVGRYSVEPETRACLPCPPGRAGAKQEGLSECEQCVAGMYASNAASRACVACAAGRFATQTGATSCSTCPLGHLCGGTRNVAPKPCAMRNASGLEARSHAVYVAHALSDPVALYCPLGAAYARMTPTGWFAAGGDTNQTHFTTLPCPAGFSCANGRAHPCPRGAFSADVGADTCKLCKAGQFSSEFATHSCMDCGVNTYSRSGAVTCHVCPPEYHAPRNGSVSCVPMHTLDVATLRDALLVTVVCLVSALVALAYTCKRNMHLRGRTRGEPEVQAGREGCCPAWCVLGRSVVQFTPLKPEWNRAVQLTPLPGRAGNSTQETLGETSPGP